MTNNPIWSTIFDEIKTGIANGDGGPFGAAVVKNGEIISSAHNTVISHHDPVAHAEINAIRQACAKLGTEKLDDCVLYTSAEPCPMCLAAAYWANLKEIIYIIDRNELKKHTGFADEDYYHEMCSPHAERALPIHADTSAQKELEDLIGAWNASDKKKMY
ncbi:MAG TPA: nucleoside deaminase [bacterium]|nr:nucleoside deaminase [bacterium]